MDHRSNRWRSFAGALLLLTLFVVVVGSAQTVQYHLQKIFAKLESDLRGICLRYYNACALFGDTPEEAFSVDTGSQVNTITTIAAGEIHAVIRLRCSPAGEWVSIEIIKVPVERAVAA